MRSTWQTCCWNGCARSRASESVETGRTRRMCSRSAGHDGRTSPRSMAMERSERRRSRRGKSGTGTRCGGASLATDPKHSRRLQNSKDRQ